jgi:hypothetical protein
MSLPPLESIKVGAYFVTPNNQLRLIFKTEKDSKDRIRIHYYAKAATYVGTPFEPIHHPSKPPLLKTFVRNCGRLLDDNEVLMLRVKKIIPPK